MTYYIINCFILQDKHTLNEIYNYIKFRYDETMTINNIKVELKKLIKKGIIFFNDNYYKLTKEGNVILDDHKYYYSKIIVNFYKKYNKNYIKYELREIRQEQQKLRNYLISNKNQICIICEKKLPLCLLETAHLKPRCILNNTEKNDTNIVEFMCRYCHNLYDNGLIAVYSGLLHVSPKLNNYDLQYDKYKHIQIYNSQNEKYFMFHYSYIYKRLL
jgi:hypothetical protein